MRARHGIWGLAVLVATTAHGQGCEAYVGTVVTPSTFQQVWAGVPAFRPKGEFESSAEYNARMASAQSKVTKPSIVLGSVNRGEIQYDADAQSLAVHQAAFEMGIATTLVREVPELEAGYRENVAALVGERGSTTGTYTGENAFGAKTRVTKGNTELRILFDRPDASLFTRSGWLGEVAAKPEDAKRLKQSAKVAWVFWPLPPYRAGSGQRIAPTRSAPADVQLNLKVLRGDIQCGLLLDGSNKVRAAFDTN